MEYHWPGNVRELRNILERAAILCDGGLITAEHLALTAAAPPAAPAASPAPRTRVAGASGRPASPSRAAAGGRDLQSVERAMIEQALQDARFNKSQGGEGARPDARAALRAHAPLRPRITRRCCPRAIGVREAHLSEFNHGDTEALSCPSHVGRHRRPTHPRPKNRRNASDRGPAACVPAVLQARSRRKAACDALCLQRALRSPWALWLRG